MDLNNPALRQALQDVELLNTPRQWAKLEVLEFPNDLVIRLDYGTIHSNGMKECAICTRSYEMKGDKLVVINRTHV